MKSSSSSSGYDERGTRPPDGETATPVSGAPSIPLLGLAGLLAGGLLIGVNLLALVLSERGLAYGQQVPAA